MKILIKRMYHKFVYPILYKRIAPVFLAQSKRIFLEEQALHNTQKGVEEYISNQPNIVVSLTTYSRKFFNVHLAVESLLHQTVKPNKIILWLAEDEFDENNIPIVLQRQQKRGLEIGFCKDIKSYKKLIPTLAKHQNDIIITVDDDVLYPFDLVENLYRAYQKDRSCVHYYVGHKMMFSKQGRHLKSYNSWDKDYQGLEKSLITLPTGVGGVLYPPHCFHKDICNSELFMKLAPKADDVWFKAMTLLNGVYCKCTPHGISAAAIIDNEDLSLQNTNVYKNGNDVQIKAVFDYYNIWEILKNSHGKTE